MVKESVISKLQFASRRLNDLKGLTANNRLSSDSDRRQQIVQEFFFHAVGATEYLAQLINEHRSLGIPPEEVRVHFVAKILNSSDSLRSPLNALSKDTRNKPLPQDPYSDEGLIYRIINYRNEVVHRNTNPFHFVLSEGPKVAYFWLDPRDHSIGKSKDKVDVDLTNMFKVINKRCHQLLKLL